MGAACSGNSKPGRRSCAGSSTGIHQYAAERRWRKHKLWDLEDARAIDNGLGEFVENWQRNCGDEGTQESLRRVSATVEVSVSAILSGDRLFFLELREHPASQPRADSSPEGVQPDSCPHEPSMPAQEHRTSAAKKDNEAGAGAFAPGNCLRELRLRCAKSRIPAVPEVPSEA